MALAFSITQSPAATVTWDADNATAGVQDGAGSWSTGNANWWNGSADNVWTNGDSALFGSGGQGGAVGVGAGTIVSSITFNTNYIINANALILTNNPVITVNGAATLATNGNILTGTAFTKEGPGTLILNASGDNTYTNTTVINNGVVQCGGNDNRIYIPSNLLVNAGGTFRFSSGSSAGNGNVNSNATVIINGGVVTNSNTSKYFIAAKVIFENGGVIAGTGSDPYIGKLTDARSGLINLPIHRNFNPDLRKSTAGTMQINSRPNSSGSDGYVLTMNAGTLVFDYGTVANAATKLKVNTALTLGGGSLVFSNGNATIAPNTENPGTGGTVILPGASSVFFTNIATTGGSATFGALTRGTGGTLNFYKLSPGTQSTATANVNGIVGGWATWNATDWLIGTTFAPYSSYTTSGDATTWTSANNVSLAGNPLANLDDTTINSLRLTAASTITINAAKTLTLSSGGLLITGTGATTITGGNLKSGLGGGDLIVHQYSSADLTIASDLSDNSTSSLTKSGTGKLILTGVNNMTGTNFLNGGTVEVANLANLASGPLVMNAGTLRYTGSDTTETRAITFNGLGGVFEVPASTTLTLGSAIKGSGASFGDLGGLTKIGNGTLALNASNYFNGPLVVSNGVVSVNGTNAYDLNTWDAGKATVYATLGGNGLIAGPVTVKSGGTLAPGNGIGTLTLGTNVVLESGSRVLLDVTNGVAGDLLAIQGNLTLNNATLAINILGSTLQLTTNTVITYTGTKTGSFNPTVSVVGGSYNGSLFVDESTPGQIKLVLSPVVVITNQPADTIVSIGDTANLSVGATGTAPLHYQWYSYGNNPNNTPTLITDETNASYSIPNAQSSDSGYYSVVITNDYSSVTSRVASVVVGNVVPLLSGPTNLTVIAGNNGTFSTTVLIANPAPTFQWQTNGVDVTGATGTSLTLTNVSYGLNNTTVSVIANNIAGSTTNTATLTVIVTPVISPQITNITVNVGDAVTMVSGATGVPTPGLQWYKNGIALTDETNASLSIASAQGSNIGNYYLIATNAAGTAISVTNKLTVLSTTLSATAFAPANGATGVCYDTPLYITFNAAITNVNSGRIRIFNVTNATTSVDTIDMSSNSIAGVQAHSAFFGDSQAFNYYPVYVTGNTATIYPHSGVLTSNQTYYVLIDNGVFTDTSGAYFAGIADTNTWQFSTKVGGPADPANPIVAADGTADFATVQAAIESLPTTSATRRIINIRNGAYFEIVNVGKTNVTFRGQSRTGTVINYPNNNNLNPTTHARMTFKVNASDVAIENLTITNSTPQGGSQAEAVMIEGNSASTAAKRCVVNNCDIASRQDTILANINASQAYFYNCKIIGNFDYIWGGGNLFFESCNMHTIAGSSQFNLTAARTDTSTTLSASTPWVNPNGTTYSANGFSFVRCLFTADSSILGVSLAANNGTPGGLDSWAFCQFSPVYTNPVSGLSNNYVFWQFQNTDTNANPISFTDIQTIGVTNNDPRLLAVTNLTTWFYGWSPVLAPNILSQPTNLTVNAGDPAAFSVSATAIPDATYQWLQNGTNSPYSANSATLTIPTAQTADAGSYSVVVSNSGGSVTSSVVTLTVVVTAPPTINGAPQLQNDGNVQISFSGNNGSAYRVWASTNLLLTPITSTWTLLSSGTFGASPVSFTDSDATNYPQRFYIISSP